MPPPAALGTWNTTLVTPGLTKETLAVYDSAGNVKKDSITLTVYNNSSTDGGANWATGFGTYTSPVMNVATDPAGNVYFAETQNSKIRKYSPRKDSLFAFSAKRGQDSTGTNWAVSMALKDSTTLYIVDGYAHCTEAFDRQGNLLLRFGSFGSGPGQFKQPCGIALDHKGRVFVVDRLNHRVQVFSDTSGAFLFQFGSQGQDSGKFNSPTGIAITLKDILLGIAQDLIWVSDTKNNQIQVFDSLGNYLKTIKQPDTLGFDTPTGICADKWGDVYVADTKHNRIVELNPYGQRILDFGGLGDSLWQFRSPIGVATSPGAHYLYVADMGNRRVQRFTVILEDSSGGGPQSGGIVQRVPLVYSLAQSHPNPTTGEALIEYGLPKESPVRLTVYNVAGQAVREYKPGKQDAGFYTYKWDGRSNLGHRVGAGVYFYRLTAGNWVKTRKMVVVR
jgi:DNA-binding beta-propeller fold protein YncE